ncbi:MAG: type II toxin-antitoxin system RelE/ParE family toxin [Chloroflexi bacterium]|nr:type II toxin-antitoxin system RelE/ParE family toxin [Chloroflexota bacterium]
MTDDVVWTADAEADLHRLDAAAADRIMAKQRRLAENADSVRVETLAGRWRGVRKLRVGSYRVLYTRDSLARRIVVHIVGHRLEIYSPAGTVEPLARRATPTRVSPSGTWKRSGSSSERPGTTEEACGATWSAARSHRTDDGGPDSTRPG